MAFTFEGSDVGFDDSGTTSVATTDAHGLSISAGDLLVASIHSNSQGTSISAGANTTGAAWTVLYDKNGEDTNRVSVQWKIANGTEDSTFTFSVGTNTRWSVAVGQFSAEDTIEIDQAVSQNNGGPSTTAQTASITTSNNSLALYVVTADRSTAPFFSGQTNGFGEIEPGTLGQSQALCYLPMTTGASISSQITLNSSDLWGTNIFSFREAAAGGSIIPQAMHHYRNNSGSGL